MKTVHIPGSVKCVGPATLNGATSLETVTGGDGVVEMDNGNGMYFNACPNLKTPVVLNNILFRLPSSTEGTFELPEHVSTIARDAMSDVPELTTLKLNENITTILGYAFSNDTKLKEIFFPAVEMPTTDREAFVNFDRTTCTLHVYEDMVELFQADELWSKFKIVGDLGSMPVVTPMVEADYTDLCAISNTLDGENWRRKWIMGKNVQTASRWRGVTFDADGYVTAIDLSNNGLGGDVSQLAFTGLTRLKSLNLGNNALTGNILPLVENLPKGCTLNVEQQELGDLGEHTLYEICRLAEGLPSIAFYNSQSGGLSSTLIGVGGNCRFYHQGTGGGDYWDGYINADGGTGSWNKFYWPSPVTIECTYPHHFTFTYRYETGDANMDDKLNVLDLQSTLNYSNNRGGGLFNFYAADTYGQDDEINVQDIVKTVNILLVQESNNPAAARPAGADSQTEGEACLSVEDGQIVLYTTKPVAACDLRLVGIAPEQLTWNTEDMGFATAATALDNGTHAIVYSMQPREIAAGRTVLATFDTSLSPYLTTAMLSDSKARIVSLGNSTPTGIRQMIDGTSLTDHSLYNLQGSKVNGQLRKGMYIMKGKKVVIK